MKQMTKSQKAKTMYEKKRHPTLEEVIAAYEETLSVVFQEADQGRKWTVMSFLNEDKQMEVKFRWVAKRLRNDGFNVWFDHVKEANRPVGLMYVEWGKEFNTLRERFFYWEKSFLSRILGGLLYT